MFPVLFSLGGVSFPSYGMLYTVAYVTAGTLAGREARRLGHSPFTVLGAIVVGVSGALFASRLLSWLIHEALGGTGHFALLQSGSTYLGAIVGFVTAVALYGFSLHAWKPTAPTIRGHLDILATVVPLGHGIGRVGCFLAGCCYGTPTESFLGVTYTAQGIAAPRGIPLHPTQLYEAGGELALFAVLWALRTRRQFEGQLLLIYLTSYAALRFVIEFFRGDERAMVGPLSVFQLLCLVLTAVGGAALAVGLVWARRRHSQGDRA